MSGLCRASAAAVGQEQLNSREGERGAEDLGRMQWDTSSASRLSKSLMRELKLVLKGGMK